MAKSGNGAAKAVAPQNGRSKPMDVGGQEALGLAAAYAGLYHLFGARVEKWDVTPEGLIAKGFSVESEYNPEEIVRDINRKDRRAPLFPAILSILNPNVEPPHFATPLDVTTFMVNFWKGSMGDNSSKTPEYVRVAAGKYKERTGTKVRKGPKVRTINLRNVREITAENIKSLGLKKEDIEYLISQASTALVDAPEAPVNVSTESQETAETVSA